MSLLLRMLIVMLVLQLPQAHGKLNVVATTPDFGAIAQEIGGGEIELTVLVKPTEDPHFVDAKPSHKVKLNRADVLIEGGAELEMGWLPALLEGARNPRLGAGKPGRISCAQGISLLEVPSELDRSRGDIHAMGNPHFMTDPLNGKKVAKHITTVFCQLDPKAADHYKNNLKEFEGKLDRKLSEWRGMLAPYRGKALVTYHNYWKYFGQQFGFPMELYLEPKPGLPPTPSHLARVITRMKSESVKVIIVQPYQNPRTAQTVANRSGAVRVDFPSFPGGSQETQGYVEWMDFLVKALVKGFEEAR